MTLAHTRPMGLPLDDSYIYLTYAKQFGRGQPFTYFPGGGYSAGSTSVLWPMLLAPFWTLGARGHALLAGPEPPALQRPDRHVEGALGSRRHSLRHREYFHELGRDAYGALTGGVVNRADDARRVVAVHHVREPVHLRVGGVHRPVQRLRVRTLGGDLDHGAHQRARLLQPLGVRVRGAEGEKTGRECAGTRPETRDIHRNRVSHRNVASGRPAFARLMQVKGRRPACD